MRRKRPTVGDWNTLGVHFYSVGAYDLAIAQLEEAVRLAPEMASIHFNLGGAYYGKGRVAEAMRGPTGSGGSAWKAWDASARRWKNSNGSASIPPAPGRRAPPRRKSTRSVSCRRATGTAGPLWVCHDHHAWH
jgi:hypothetical protein